MLDLPPAATAPANVTVSVAAVVTTAQDGLARVLRPGRVRVQVPALLTVRGPAVPAWLEVNGTPGSAVALAQGAPQRLAATFVARPGSSVTVRLVAGGGVVTQWQHRVAR